MEHKKPRKTVENRIQNKQDKNVERENAEKETTAEKNFKSRMEQRQKIPESKPPYFEHYIRELGEAIKKLS